MTDRLLNSSTIVSQDVTQLRESDLRTPESYSDLDLESIYCSFCGSVAFADEVFQAPIGLRKYLNQNVADFPLVCVHCGFTLKCYHIAQRGTNSSRIVPFGEGQARREQIAKDGFHFLRKDFPEGINLICSVCKEQKRGLSFRALDVVTPVCSMCRAEHTSRTKSPVTWIDIQKTDRDRVLSPSDAWKLYCWTFNARGFCGRYKISEDERKWMVFADFGNSINDMCRKGTLKGACFSATPAGRSFTDTIIPLSSPPLPSLDSPLDQPIFSSPTRSLSISNQQKINKELEQKFLEEDRYVELIEFYEDSNADDSNWVNASLAKEAAEHDKPFSVNASERKSAIAVATLPTNHPDLLDCDRPIKQEVVTPPRTRGRKRESPIKLEIKSVRPKYYDNKGECEDKGAQHLNPDENNSDSELSEVVLETDDYFDGLETERKAP